MISINKLHKSFDTNHVLNNITVDFSRPGITAVLGPNGSGKTTLIKCILGMVIPDKGDIRMNGENILGQWAHRQQIDYLPQIARFPENLTTEELIEMVKDIRGEEIDANMLIDTFELSPFLDKKLGKLSGGTRQKVNLVVALMYDSPVIILDEPTVGLDPVALQRLKKLLKEESAKNKTILITTHIMSFVEEVAENIIFLLEGEVEFDGTTQMLRDRYSGDSLEESIANILVNDPDPDL
ncbi:MAG: ABC transporter ATP-binding protein [Saprospiraceae bacterium]|nr:ABC transporter ATP-binding protein [Saprospiraceae bacterium]